MATLSLEERVTALEAEMQHIKQQQTLDKHSDEPRGWQHIVGIFKDDPAFDEMMRYGREWRASEDTFDEQEKW